MARSIKFDLPSWIVEDGASFCCRVALFGCVSVERGEVSIKPWVQSEEGAYQVNRNV